MDKIQKPITVKHAFFKVTTCLYLSPSNKARSLSKLIAVNINKDTEHKTVAKKCFAAWYCVVANILSSFTTEVQ